MARPPPASQVYVSTDLSMEEKTALLFGVCQELLPGWEQLKVADIKVTTVSGGISNMTLKFTPADAALFAVAVKVFGDKTEVLIDRDRERQSLVSLNAAGFGAEVLGFFRNGRLERFLNAKTLQPVDMSSVAYLQPIATKLHELHTVRVNGWEFTDSLFPTIHAWFKIASQLSFVDATKQRTYSGLDFGWMAAEIAQLQRLCAATGSPVVFAHCDLLSGNILEIQDAEPVADTGALPLQFIDFEYSNYCPRGFDFGNHFNEYAGFDCDYSLYPTDRQQQEFFRAYLAASGVEEVDQAELDSLVAEANLFSLVSHVYWGVWALVQARYSAIDFDFLGYSIMRWDQYRKTKATFVEQAEAAFPCKAP